ncbi:MULTISPECIES: MFS transporter [Actinoalloteichus]|uniref:Arabinose efflux permease family protein n=1 Tax=Actinoalloteichus fjordicus TaxID=1612552 RepID=A0AAC9LK75_9PSEU|nr:MULTISPECIES: MFS transporter [Actinoalloteichus]APU17800.1 arabinose efflux permease family protein [Actinoalloteichus fjordicus]APU23879.1 arabinose efflux permease family protein [Actinoalloteichus sp. GBA129-24]
MSLANRLIDLRPLRSSRAFRELWLGSLLSGLGQQVASVAVLLQVWQLTHDPVWTGAIGLATAVPLLVFTFVGGSLADALDRRRLVLLTSVGQFLAALGLAVQAFSDTASLALVLGLVSVQAACGALGAPARRTMPTRLLVTGQVAAGVALQNIAFQASMLLGPALAGLILAEWGLTAAYLGQAVACGAALISIVRLPDLPPLGRPDRPGLRATIDGWRLVARRPELWGCFATDLAATLLAMPVALFPLVNEIRFDGDPRTLGLFLTAVAVGGIGAGLISGTVIRLRRSGVVQLVAAGTWGIALAVFGLAGPFWLAFVALVVAGAADTVSVVTRGAMVQLTTPDSHRGRVSAVEHVIGAAGPEVGNFRAGLVAGGTSAPFALVTGGLACVVVVAIVGMTNRPYRRFCLPTPEESGH